MAVLYSPSGVEYRTNNPREINRLEAMGYTIDPRPEPFVPDPFPQYTTAPEVRQIVTADPEVLAAQRAASVAAAAEAVSDRSTALGAAAAGAFASRGVVNRGMVCFVWDDGFDSHDTVAAMATARGQQHTFAVVPGLLGTAGYATSEQVAAWHAAGHEIASHSQTHARMADLSVAARVAQYDDSKANLEAIVGAGEVRSFAYPFGGSARTGVTDSELYLRYDRIIDTGPGLAVPLHRRGDFLIRRFTWNGQARNHVGVLNQIRYAADHPVIVVLTAHDLDAASSPTTAQVTEAMNLAQSLGVPCVTVKDAFPSSNLLVDPGFETPDLPDWTVITSDANQSGGSVLDAPAAGLSGSRSLYLRTAAASGAFVYAYQVVPVEPGVTYRAACRYRQTTTTPGTGGLSIRLREYSYDPQAAVASQVTSTTLASSTWASGSVDFAPTKTGRYVSVEMLLNNNAAEAWVDHFDFRPVMYGNFA